MNVPSSTRRARWGGALVDLGITEDGLSEGYGMAYARALDEFRPPHAREAAEPTHSP